MIRLISKWVALAVLATGAACAQLVTVTCTPAALPQVVGTPVSVTCTASGGLPPYTWSISTGALPPGLSQETGSGNLTGTLADPPGAYSFTVMATDSTPVLQLTGTQLYSGTTADPLAVNCLSAQGPVEVGVPYSNSCTASGGTPPYNWSITGANVPSGLPGSITPTGNPATITYTPAAALPAYQYDVVATDSGTSPQTTQVPFSGAIAPAVTISTTSLAPGVAGSAYSTQFAATGGVAPFSWTATGLSGTGLSMSSGGLLSGTPATAGTIDFSVTVADGAGGGSSGPFSLTVNPALTITTTSPLSTATIGAAYTAAFAATGGSGAGYTWSVTSGSLPAGLSLAPGGTVSGTPLSNAVTSSFTVKVTDSNNGSASGPFILPVKLTITTTSTLPSAAIGIAYPAQQLTAQGGTPPYIWSITTGSLPAGLGLNAVTGVVSGTPAQTALSSTFTVTVRDGTDTTASLGMTLPVTLTILTSSPLARGAIGALYNQTLVAGGGTPPYSNWVLASGSPPLPGGLALDQSSGAITGTPTASGTFTPTIQVSDNTATSVTKPFAITINTGLTITTTSPLPNATVGINYSQTLAAAGGTSPYTWSVKSGALPGGISLASSGAITGKPTATGTASFTVTVADSAGTSADQPLTLTVVSTPVITTASLPNGTAGAAYSQTLAGSGGTPPYKWAVSSGSLPAGLSLSLAGAITGAPGAAGTASFTVQLTDNTGVTASKALTLTIVSGVTISTASPLPPGELAITYSQTLSATGGTPPYAWSKTAGALPQGLTLAANGAISGAPSAAGTFSFTAQVSDGSHVTASAAFELTIAGGVGISTPSGLSSGSVGSSYSQNLEASAGVTPYTWNLAAGTLPPGLTLSSAGAITGVATTAGSYTFTARVTDAVGATASRQFTIGIATGLTVSSPAVLPGGTVGSSYAYSLQALGGTTPYTWTITVGSAPPGLSLKLNGGLTGVPTAAGPFTFTVQVLDSAGHQATEQVSVTVAPALSITTNTLPGGTVGASYSQALTATGGTPPYAWSVAIGALPEGLGLSAAGSITGTLSAAGSFAFTVQVLDSLSVSAVKQFQITVASGLSITTAAALPNASINVSYSQTLAAAGGTTPYTWAVTSGALPAGLTLSAGGAISGTPTAGGTYHFTATVTDSASATASQQFTLIVAGGLTITTTSLPNGKSGAPYSQVVTVAGGTAPYTFSTTSGTLPPGISLSGDTLSGTPTAPGSYTFTVEVTDSVSASATQQLTIVIGGLTITTAASLPSAALGTAYSQAVTAAGTPPYTWAITQGALPDGLSLDASSGVISGTPAAAGSFNMTVQVTDDTKAAASAALTLLVVSGAFTGLTSTAAPAQQVSGSLALDEAYPSAISGQVMLTFQPDGSLASPADDPSIQFSGGGRTASFTIPAHSTAPISFSLQTGTVAGAITVSVSWQAGGAALPSPAALTQTMHVAPAVPAITAVTASTTSSGFQVVITGYSNTREVSQALLQFTPAPGQSLQTTSLPVALSSAATTWFQSSTSDQYGSQFILTLPFDVTAGTASAIGSISVQLQNSQGTSASVGTTL